MEQKRKPSVYPVIAGVALVLYAMTRLRLAVRIIEYGADFVPFYIIILAMLCAFAAVTMFTLRRDWMPVAAFGLLALLDLYSFVAGLGADHGFSLVTELIWQLAPLLRAVSAALTALLLAMFCLNILPQWRGNGAQLWFVPALLYATQTVLYQTWQLLEGYDFGDFLVNLLMELINEAPFIAALALAALWAVRPYAAPRAVPSGQSAGTDAFPAGSAFERADAAAAAPSGEGQPGYCSLAKHILLLLFTFGIWNLIWIYRTTEFLNCVHDEPPRDPTKKLLLCMFVPFYPIYWVYQSAKRVDRLAAQRGVPSDIATICLVLEFFIPIVPAILLQDKINTAAAAAARPAEPAASAPAAPAEPAASVPSEAAAPEQTGTDMLAAQLRTYKQLLDTGVITQEEFDAKKKQLLGL